MTEEVNQVLDVIGAYGVEGLAGTAGAAGIYWVAKPSLVAVGKAFGDWTEYRMRNLLGIGEKLNHRRDYLGECQPSATSDAPAVEVGEGDVIHPRVLYDVLEQGSWSDDDVAQDYLAGLLVSSRSPDGKDDSGAYFARIANLLTGPQIRVHAAIYGALAGTMIPGDDLSIATKATDPRLRVIAEPSDVAATLGSEAGYEAWAKIMTSLMGLYREGLIGDYSFNAYATPTAGPEMFAASPTSLGAHLYLRARGVVDARADALRQRGTRLQPFLPEPRKLTTARIGEMT